MCGGGGNFLTQAYPTNFHVYPTKKPLLPGESADDWREVTPAEKAAIEAQDAKWVRPPQAIIEMWNSLDFCSYNEETGFFETTIWLDGTGSEDVGFKDIACPEAITMLINRHTGEALTGMGSIKARCNLYPHNYSNPQYLDQSVLVCAYNDLIEILWLAPSGANYPSWTALKSVMQCKRLRVIVGRFNVSGSLTFSGLPSLEELRVALRANVRIDISSSPNISLASLRYTIDNANTISGGTIVVHPDVYAKLTDESNAEWHQALLDAIEKDIIYTVTTSILQ